MILLVNLSSLTLEEVNKFYEETGLSFIVKDGKIKGFTRKKEKSCANNSIQKTKIKN